MNGFVDKLPQHDERPENMFQNKSQPTHPNVDYECLRIYDENNERFSMAIITEREEGEEEQAIGYDCFYSSGSHRLKFQFNIQNGLWKTIPVESNGKEQLLAFEWIFHEIQFLTLDEQIRMIIQRVDQYFAALDRMGEEIRYAEKRSMSPMMIKEENEMKCIDSIAYQTSASITIPEDDEPQKDVVDYGFHSFVTGSRPKFTGLAPPPIAPRRSRQNSACSTQSSVRYASFLPPPTAPVRRRRVIESILLHVQRKKKPFDKIVDVLKGIERPTMYDLGLEFLRVYDGRFNYRDGHTFVMSFRKKTWFLTIDQVKCVDCPVNDIGPRSVLILNYKGHYTSVHV